ncbi:MAG: 3-oxoacyl-[acyl-carrier-protein] reductase [Saprospiraceae bacterium]
MPLLEGKVAIVTGGSRGIGRAIVDAFAAEGASVAFTYLSSREKAEAIAAEWQAKGVNVMASYSDASSYVHAESLVPSVLEKFGRIDILVNNAGITNDTLMLRMDEDQWDSVIDTNLKSVFNMTKQCIKVMLRQKSGSLIHMSSVVGIFGNAGQANYAASKAGIIGFSKSIAKEVGSRNIRSNVIAPGFIESDMTEELDENMRKAFLANVPLKRFGQASEVASLAVFFASEMSSYITGQTISVCGGLNT